ncbi:hypothetical protein D046_0952B, partial [Vibrio parahaemolyticus V-223/04]
TSQPACSITSKKASTSESLITFESSPSGKNCA